MKIEYKLTREDLIDFNIYLIDIRANRIKQKLSRLVMPIIFSMFGLFFLYAKSMITSFFFLICALLWAGLFPLFQARGFQKRVEKFVDTNQANEIDSINSLEIESSDIRVKRNNIINKIKYSDIQNIVREKNHVFIFISEFDAIILPKNSIEDKTLNELLSGIENSAYFKKSR